MWLRYTTCFTDRQCDHMTQTAYLTIDTNCIRYRVPSHHGLLPKASQALQIATHATRFRSRAGWQCDSNVLTHVIYLLARTPTSFHPHEELLVILVPCRPCSVRQSGMHVARLALHEPTPAPFDNVQASSVDMRAFGSFRAFGSSRQHTINSSTLMLLRQY